MPGEAYAKLNPMPPALTLKFAVLSSGGKLEEYQLLAVQKLLEVEGVELAALIAASDTPFENAGDLPGLLHGSPSIAWTDFQAVQSCGLDFALNFTAREPTPSLRDLPRFGVWGFRHGIGRAGPAVSRLERAGGGVLQECAIETNLTSYARTLHALLIAAADMPARVCKELLCGRPLPSPERPRSIPGPPGRLQKILLPGLEWASWTRLQISSLLFSETWNVGVVDAPIHRFLDPGFRPEVTWLPKSEGLKFIADPFAVAEEDRLTIFVEEFDYGRYQGYISTIEFREGRPPSAHRTIIDEGVHMSYPFLLRHRGELYCLPEMCLNCEVRLYRFEPARNSWTVAATIISGFPAADSTVVEYEGRWWLFCTHRDDYPDAKLYIWHADDLFGPWQPHSMNPVKCDVTSSRPGGTPFFYAGVLYRPAQDSSASYGGALAINRVTCLTLDAFREEPAVRIPPLRQSLYPDGIHTISAAGRYTVIDAKRMAILTPRLKMKLLHKLKRARQALVGR